MERWRWLPRELPADRIQVNVAAAVLTVFSARHPDPVDARGHRPAGRRDADADVDHRQHRAEPAVERAGRHRRQGAVAQGRKAYLRRNGFVAIPTGDGGSRLQQKAGPQARWAG
jgi:hypothetical protein